MSSFMTFWIGGANEADIAEEEHPKVDAQWWSENPPGCHLFTAAYAQRYRLRRLHEEEEEEKRGKPVSKL